MKYNRKHLCENFNEMYFLVPPVPVVVTPANPDVTIGGNTTIVCSVNSSIPIYQFVWILNGHLLPPNIMVRSSTVVLNTSRGAWFSLITSRSRGAKFVTLLECVITKFNCLG